MGEEAAQPMGYTCQMRQGATPPAPWMSEAMRRAISLNLSHAMRSGWGGALQLKDCARVRDKSYADCLHWNPHR